MYLIYWLCIHLQVKVVFTYNIYSMLSYWAQLLEGRLALTQG